MNIKFILTGMGKDMLVGEFEIKEDYSYDTILDTGDIYATFIDSAREGTLEVDIREQFTDVIGTIKFKNETNDLKGFCEGLKYFIELLGIKVLCDS